MNRVKVWLLYAAYSVLFAVVFAVMFLLLMFAVTGVPTGLLFSIFGIAMIMFKADFVITRLAPEIMLFGGLSLAFTALFCGLIAVRAGMLTARLFMRIKRRCDKLRGW